MKNKLVLLLILPGALYGAPPRESLATQELKATVDQMHFQLNGHQVELDLAEERLHSLETLIKELKNTLSQNKGAQPLDKRLSTLEKANETLINDFKTLKNGLTEMGSTVNRTQTKITQIEHQLSSDIKTLKNSLQSMVALLQKESGIEPAKSAYLVQPGDSLGQIALAHKVDIKKLKQFNNLASDTIYTGQKLLIPSN